jgi:hypothetical protein
MRPLFANAGNDLLGEVIQIGFELLGVVERSELTSIERVKTDASCPAQIVQLGGLIDLALLHPGSPFR